MPRRIGILTAGGDCPGLNAVIRAVVKTASNDYGIETVGFMDGYEGLIKNKMRYLGYDDVSGILTRGGTILGTNNKCDPFRVAEKKKGKLTFKDRSKEALRTYRLYNLEALVCVGGDGTLTVASKLAKLGMNVIGVPKTIDNDLLETDYTFGYDSARAIATDAVDKIHTTAMSHHRVMVIEVMGRYAGWLALGSGLAGGGDVILIPEIPFKIESIAKKVVERGKTGRRFSIIVVAEGAKEKGKKQVVRKMIKGSADQVRLGGIGQVVADKLEKKTSIASRVTVLGHLQRGGSPTAFDRILATQFGCAAVELIEKKKYGRMVALQGNRVVDVPVEKVAGDIKRVPLDSPLIKAAKSTGVIFGE